MDIFQWNADPRPTLLDPGTTVASHNVVFDNIFYRTGFCSCPVNVVPGTLNSGEYMSMSPISIPDNGYQLMNWAFESGSPIEPTPTPFNVHHGTIESVDSSTSFDNGPDQTILGVDYWHQDLTSVAGDNSDSVGMGSNYPEATNSSWYDFSDNSSGFGNLQPDVTFPNPTTVPAQQVPPANLPCQHGCNKVFGRSADRDRHDSTIHGINRGTHLCNIAGCIKSQDGGYSRADKLKEHMWKKHADLGYVKGRA